MNSVPTSRESLTDWERVDGLRDGDIDLSECPEITPEMFARATLRYAGGAVADGEKVTLDVDPDVLAWFKAQGEGYQQRINAILRAYKDLHEKA